MTAPAAIPHPWDVTKATYTRRKYRLPLITLWAMLLVAFGSFIVGQPVIGLFFIVPSLAGNFALSRRVQRDLAAELAEAESTPTAAAQLAPVSALPRKTAPRKASSTKASRRKANTRKS